MGTLTAAERKKLKPSQFAGPGRTYPDEDHGHAVAAKSRAKEMLNRGTISKAEYDNICARADKELSK